MISYLTSSSISPLGRWVLIQKVFAFPGRLRQVAGRSGQVFACSAGFGLHSERLSWDKLTLNYI